ncbi:Zn2-C6 fungal-type DNA-binding domain protein [Gigaspora margarita]|uniref:Zn2-C6 fungal-type DNA-binding domain protein n=1 Tax=Gigaspora margarita TaxID=4874 RepID=A0A8H3XEB2_GIGMA|nr:Zn2-C6 fungal-type DNA-binding domain protein [Gigaspora margarita]
MSFQRRQKQKQQQRRGFYVTRACTNCQKKYAKCSGGTMCKRCTLRNLECTFIDSGKKRGPKTDSKYSVQVYIPNGSENDFDRLSSVIPKPVQGHASTLSLSGCLQQQPANVDDVTFYPDFSDPEQVYILNNFENDIDGTFLPYSMTPNPMQGHASIPSLSEYPQKQSDNVYDVTLYSESYEETITNAFQNAGPFSYQTHIDTGYTMQTNNLTDNTSNNNNNNNNNSNFFLCDDLFSYNKFIPSFHN